MKSGRQSESFTSTCKEVLGQKAPTAKEWISAETLKKIKERKRKKAEINNSCTWAGKARAYKEYSFGSKIVKNSIKADKRDYMNMLAIETEEVSHQGNLWVLYTTIKRLSGKFEKPERPVEAKGGKPIPDGECQKKRLMEHFEELVNRPTPQDLPDIPGHQTVEELQVSRTRQYPSRGFENGYRDQCGASVPTLQEDLGRRTSPIRMEEGQPQAAKEWWPQLLFL